MSLPHQCSPQAVQPRPGPLGLAWLAGLVGLVLAPSRLGTRRDRSESWTEYGQGLRAIPIWLQSTLYWALGRAPPGLPGLRVPPAWYPGQPRPGFLYGLWGALFPTSCSALKQDIGRATLSLNPDTDVSGIGVRSISLSRQSSPEFQ